MSYTHTIHYADRFYPGAPEITPEQAIAELREAGAEDFHVSHSTMVNKWQPVCTTWFVTLFDLFYARGGDYQFSADTLREATDKALEALK